MEIKEKDKPTIREQFTQFTKVKRIWPVLITIAVILALGIVILLCAGCSDGSSGTTNTSSNLLQSLQDKNTVQDSRLAIIESKEGKDWASDINSIKGRLSSLEGNIGGGTNYSTQITTLQTQVNSLQTQVNNLVSVVANMSTGGSSSSSLSVTILGSLPVIVTSDDYPFTIRVVNSGTATVAGNIVLQLTAKSGMVSGVSASVDGWQDAILRPTAASCGSITIVSNQIYLLGGSSTIYQFTLSLSQIEAFEWVPTLTITK